MKEADYGLFAKDRELYEKDQAALNALRYIWDTNGRLPNGEKVSLEHTFEIDNQHMEDSGMGDQPGLTQRVIEEISNEAVEPTAVLTGLLETINLKQPGSILTVPNWGGMHAADVPAGGEYPERSMELAGYVMAAIGKVGIKVPISDEMVSHSSFDVVSKHLRAASAAMIRHKEQKIADAMSQHGQVLFDNTVDGVKSTTGRNGAGAFNGTLTLDDIAYAHEQMTENGFQPDTMVIHPAAWRVLSIESLRILFGLQRGVTWSADPSPSHRGSNTGRSASEVTSRFPQDWNIIVSPYVAYTASGGTDNPNWPITDIMICDSNAIGAILATTSGVETEDFRDPTKDIRKVKLREIYGISITNDGDGIGLIKNVAVGRGIDFWEEAVTTVSISDGLTLDRNFTGLPLTGAP
jgi:hypothetical protein